VDIHVLTYETEGGAAASGEECVESVGGNYAVKEYGPETGRHDDASSLLSDKRLQAIHCHSGTPIVLHGFPSSVSIAFRAMSVRV
jgi:hypothetical protein